MHEMFAVHVMMDFGRVFYKHNSLPLGPIQPSTKERHAIAKFSVSTILERLNVYHSKTFFPLRK